MTDLSPRAGWYERSPGGGILFSLCHLAGMLSGLANPLLYGYFNKVPLIRNNKLLNAFNLTLADQSVAQ